MQFSWHGLTHLSSIFWSFFKISPVTFGGGYAMLPMIEREVVHTKRWVTEEEMADVLSIAGSAPGGIGVNAAAFIGYRLAGIAGAVAAVAGIAIPTFMIIFIMCVTFSKLHNHLFEAAFQGIHGAIIALIIVAAYRMGKAAITDRITLLTAIVTVLLLFDFHIHPVLLIIIGIAAGIIIVQVKQYLGLNSSLQPHKSTYSQEYLFREDI